MYQFTNNAIGTLKTEISDSDTLIDLDSGQGVKFPTTGVFRITIWDPQKSAGDADANMEIIEISSRSTDRLTVATNGRGKEGTSAVTHIIGSNIVLQQTSELITDLIQKRQEVIVGMDNACDYVCDGTADDVQINAAIDALKLLGGGTIKIMKGTYDITAICALESNITIIGEDKYNTILKVGTGADTSIFINNNRVSGDSNISIENLTLDGNKAEQSAGGTDGAMIFLENVSNFRISNIIAKNGKSYGISGRNCHHGWICDNECYGSRDQDGISFYGDVYYLIIDNNISYSNAQGGIEIDGSNEGDEPYYCVVTNNICYLNGEGGINIDKQQEVIDTPPTYSSKQTIVANNICYKNTGYGIEIPIDVEIVVIDGNICSENSLGGIVCHSADNHTISNNTCFDNDPFGIQLTYADAENVNNCVVANNNCFNYTTTDQDYGILLQNVYNTVVSGNNCWNNTKYGIQGSLVFRSNIISNNCNSNQEFGILLNNSDKNNISNNIANLNQRHGMRLTSGQYNVVSNNVFCNNSQETPNEYINLYIEDDFASYSRYSQYNIISGNMLIGDGSDVKYGLRIDANNNNNKVFGNQCLGAATSNYSDASTDTVIDINTETARTETRTGAGALDPKVPITYIVTTGANAITLADGRPGFQKRIIMKTDSGTGTLTATNAYNFSSIIFDDVGDSANLHFLDGKWVFMGGTATLT